MKSRGNNELWVVQANELAVHKIKESLYKLNLTDRRLMTMLIAKVDPYMVEDEFPWMEVRVTEFQEINGLELRGSRSFEALEAAVTKLMGTVISFPDRNHPGKMKIAQLLTEGEYIKGEGWIRVKLHRTLKPVLTQLNREFFKYRLEVTGKLHSSYALRLYEFIKSKEHLEHKHLVLSVNEVREILHVPSGKLSRMNQLKEKAIEVAVKGVSEATEVEASFDLQRRGRGGKVSGIILSWKRKKAGSPGKSANPKTEFEKLTKAEKSEFWLWFRRTNEHESFPLEPSWDLIDPERIEKGLNYWHEDRCQSKLPLEI